MIQFNLLPDVKIEYIKAQRTRRAVVTIAILITAVSLTVFGLSLGANILQKKHLSDLDKDIKTETTTLKATPQLDKILTVQTQLASLTTLHDGKPATTRLFDYLNQLTPAKASITNFTTDFIAHTVVIVGTADSLSTVNQYIDTLKFTTYKSDTVTTDTPAFTGVVLTSFGLVAGLSSAQSSTFNINFSYDPSIFDIKQKVTLNVPTTITTRSQLDRPADLFTAAPVAPAATTSTSTPGVKK